MLTNEQRDTLILFNEKTEILRKSRFMRQLRTRGLGITEHWKTGEPFRVGGKRPDDEAIAAAILTLRFFIRAEPCSIQNLSKIYSGLTKPAGIAKEFAEARRILNEYLNAPLHPKLVVGAKPSSSQTGLPLVGGCELSRHDVLKLAMNGNFFHADVDKRKKYKAIFAPRFFVSQILTAFILVMANLIRVVSDIEQLNRKALRANRQVSSSQETLLSITLGHWPHSSVKK